jgi:hypothetical protein
MYTTIDQLNITGIDGIFVYLAQNDPIFVPAMLIFIWLVVTLIIYFGSRRWQGNSDFFVASAAGGFFAFILAVMLTLTTGIIGLSSIIIMLAITGVSVIASMIKRNRD